MSQICFKITWRKGSRKGMDETTLVSSYGLTGFIILILILYPPATRLIMMSI